MIRMYLYAKINVMYTLLELAADHFWTLKGTDLSACPILTSVKLYAKHYLRFRRFLLKSSRC